MLVLLQCLNITLFRAVVVEFVSFITLFALCARILLCVALRLLTVSKLVKRTTNHTVHSTPFNFSVHCSLYAIYLNCILCTVHSMIFIVYCILCTIQNMKLIVYFILCTVQCIIFIIYCILCTEH